MLLVRPVTCIICSTICVQRFSKQLQHHVLIYTLCLQCANFVRAHKLWRHVTYPGGVVPQSEIVTQMQRLSTSQTGNQADNVQRQ